MMNCDEAGENANEIVPGNSAWHKTSLLLDVRLHFLLLKLLFFMH